MSSPASIKRHPLHPMLIPLPIGLWIFSLISDIIYKFGWGGNVWGTFAFYTMAGGIIGALLAALPGFVDLISLGNPKVKSIALWHMSINLLAVVVFAANFWLRMRSAPESNVPVALSVVGIALICVSGWLGGELVYVHGVAVEPKPSKP